MGRSIALTGYVGSGVSAPTRRMVFRNNTIQPRCIVHHRIPRKGDVVTYNPAECIRQKDGAVGSFALDVDGVPTIVGAVGTLGIEYGVYECTVSFNGTSEVVPVTHNDDAAIMANFLWPTLDSNGWPVWTPSSSARLLYVDNGDVTSAQGPSNNDSDYYTMASQPTGGWEDPTAVNAFANIEDAVTRLRDGFDDRILLRFGDVYVPTGLIWFDDIGGISAAEPMMIMGYGDRANGRWHLNPAAGFSGDTIIRIWPTDKYLSFSGGLVYPTYRDPDHVDFAGWGNTAGPTGFSVYPGDYSPPNPSTKHIFMDDMLINFCAGNISGSGQGGVESFIFYRSLSINAYEEEGNNQGFFAGVSVADEDAHVLAQESIFNHNGWRTRVWQLEGTSTGGSTSSMIDTGASFGVNAGDFIGTVIRDEVTDGLGVITSHTESPLTIGFTVLSGSLDFTGGGVAYTIGELGRREQGAATIFTHNIYWGGVDEGGIRSCHILDASSIAAKITSAAYRYIDLVSVSVDDFAVNMEITGDTSGAVADIKLISGTSPNYRLFYYLDDWTATDFSSSGETITVTSGGTGVGVKNTSAPDWIDQHPFRDFIEDWNCLVYNELSLGGGGNDDVGDTRFQDLRTTDNVMFNMGATDPTNRGAGWGPSSVDWNRGILSNNMMINFPGDDAVVAGITNTRAMSMGGTLVDIEQGYNKAFNIGLTSGSAASNSGGLIIDALSVGDQFTNVSYRKNEIQQHDVDAVCVGEWISSLATGNIDMVGNTYWTARSGTDFFVVDAAPGTFSAFVTETGETGAFEKIDYLDEGVSVENFQRSRGGTPTIAALFTELEALGRDNWDTSLAADEVVAYARRCLSHRPEIVLECQYLRLTNVTEGDVQNISFSNAGVPKGALFIMPEIRDGAGVHYGAYGYSVGFADADGNQWCIQANCDFENIPSQDNDYRQYDGSICGFPDRGEWSLKTSGGFFTSNQIAIELTQSGSEAFGVFVVAIGGDDVDSVKVGNDPLGTAAGKQVIQTGHRTDLFYAATVFDDVIQPDYGTGDPTPRADTFFSWGIAARTDAGIDSMSLANMFPQGTVNTSISNGLYNDAMLAKITHPSTENLSISCTAMTKTGVVIDVEGTPASEIFGWMSISFKKRPKMSMTDTTIAAASNISLSDVGYQGGFCLWFNMTGLAAYNTPAAFEHAIGVVMSDGVNTYTSSVGATEGVQNVDFAGGCYGNSGLEMLAKGATISLDLVSTSFTLTKTGVNSALSTQAAANIPGRILMIGGVN